MDQTFFYNLYNARKSILYFYSPYSFLFNVAKDTQLEHCVLMPLKEHIQKNHYYNINVNGLRHCFVVHKLEWDSNFFGINIYQLKYCLFDHNKPKLIKKAINKLIAEFPKPFYLFAELPSEDTNTIQGMGLGQFKLVETRLTYFCNEKLQLEDKRYDVRTANEADIENLKRVAMTMRNDYDRFHADKIFSLEKADDFLATYVEQSIKGFADIVLVPSEDGVSSNSFLTAKYLEGDSKALGEKISKMVLSAVDTETNRGWYKKLISEMTHHLKGKGADYIFMNTQSTNKAVIHVWESLGYKYGKTTHILSYSEGY